MKRIIYALGETVFDIIFRNNIPDGGCPGGSVLNTAVSLGRLGYDVSLISEYGRDKAGEIIDVFLALNGVKTDLVYHYTGGKTPVALAFLDEEGSAKYDFYKILPQNRLDIHLPKFNKNDILTFSSFFSVNKDIRDKIKLVLDAAKSAGSIILYDPNFRKPHLKDLPELEKSIMENIRYADIIRASDEDCKLIFESDDSLAIYNSFGNPEKVFIYTTQKSAQIIQAGRIILLDAYNIAPVSTIGAGDSFNAGVISALIKQNVTRNQLSSLDELTMIALISEGIDFATDVCMSTENYISHSFATMRTECKK